jgi:hypothetical protein
MTPRHHEPTTAAVRRQRHSTKNNGAGDAIMDEAKGEYRCETPPARTTAAVRRQRQSTKNNGAGDAIMDEAKGEYCYETPPATTTAAV